MAFEEGTHKLQFGDGEFGVVLDLVLMTQQLA